MSQNPGNHSRLICYPIKLITTVTVLIKLYSISSKNVEEIKFVSTAIENLISVLFYLPPPQFYFIFKAIAIHFQSIQYFSEETKEGPDEMTGI